MGIFFVERYWPGVTADVFDAAVARIDVALVAARSAGRDIRRLGSTLVPAEESVFSVFEAVDDRLVAEVNDRAQFSYDRLLPAHTTAKELT